MQDRAEASSKTGGCLTGWVGDGYLEVLYSVSTKIRYRRVERKFGCEITTRRVRPIFATQTCRKLAGACSLMQQIPLSSPISRGETKSEKIKRHEEEAQLGKTTSIM